MLVEIVAVVIGIAAAPYLAPEILGASSALALSLVAAGVAGMADYFGQAFLVDLGVEKRMLC